MLQCDGELSVGDPDKGNLLVQGDNLLALKALLPYYAGKVKCIYIDPPYNTGEQKWTYNDNVDSPDIRKWLGQVVGKEADDLSRHDKWLCMMYPRIQLLVQFLRKDGFLCISLDDTELPRFRLIMDEILPPNNYVCTMIWKSRRNLDNRSLHNVSVDHEYVVVFQAGCGAFRGSAKDMNKYSNPDSDPRGPWMSDNLVGLATKDRRPNLHYDLTNPETNITYPCPAKGWRYSPETMATKIQEGRIIWPAKPSGRPRHKKFVADLRNDYAGFSSLLDCGNTNEGTEEVARIMGGEVFIFPKPRSLVQTIIEQTTADDDIILDSFAGTGTTGHAVLAQNNADGNNRRFILVEMDAEIANRITSERIKRVISGYSYTDNVGKCKRIEGLGGGFRYCKLGEPLFDEEGKIRPGVKFPELAAHVFFTETGSPIPISVSGKTPFLGTHENKAVYLLFNGVLGDKRPRGGNVLTSEVLRDFPPHDGMKIIYGEGCRLGAERLRREGIVFKQVPYQIKVS